MRATDAFMQSLVSVRALQIVISPSVLVPLVRYTDSISGWGNSPAFLYYHYKRGWNSLIAPTDIPFENE